MLKYLHLSDINTIFVLDKMQNKKILTQYFFKYVNEYKLSFINYFIYIGINQNFVI